MISVVIPNYNYRRFLERRLLSVFGQTRRDMEIIFIDDCSTDGSADLARRLLARSGLPHAIHVNERNTGSVFPQWNKGLALARGEYIWFAESDDIAAPGLLAAAVAALEKDPRVGIAFAASEAIDEHDRIVRPDFYPRLHSFISPDRWLNDYVKDGPAEIREALFIMNTIPNASAAVIRTEALRAAGGVPEGFVLSGDWLTYQRILCTARVAFIHERLNFNRLHRRRVTFRHDRGGLYFAESLAIAEEMTGRIAIPETSLRKYLENFFAQYLLAAGGYRMPPEILARVGRLFPPALVNPVIAATLNRLADRGADRFSRLRRRLESVTLDDLRHRLFRRRI